MLQPDPHNILAVLTGEGGALGLYLAAARRGHLERDRDFTGVQHTGKVEEMIFTDRPQLLVIDLLLFDLRRTVEFVAKMKAKNPQLVAILYSPADMSHPIFEEHISSSSETIKLFAIANKRFLTGKLRPKVLAD